MEGTGEERKAGTVKGMEAGERALEEGGLQPSREPRVEGRTGESDGEEQNDIHGNIHISTFPAI